MPETIKATPKGKAKGVEKKLTPEQDAFVKELETLGEHRKALYEFLLSEGFVLNEAAHNRIKALFNGAVRVETDRLVKEKGVLAAQLDQKFSKSANEVFQELRKLNFQQFGRSFKPKHQAVLQVVIKRLHQYMESGKQNTNEGQQ